MKGTMEYNAVRYLRYVGQPPTIIETQREAVYLISTSHEGEWNFDNAVNSPWLGIYIPHEEGAGVHYGEFRIVPNSNFEPLPDSDFASSTGSIAYVPESQDPPTQVIKNGVEVFELTIYNINFYTPLERVQILNDLPEGRDVVIGNGLLLNNIPFFKLDENRELNPTRDDLYMGCAYKNGVFYQESLNLDDPYVDSTSEDEGGDGTPDWSDDPIDFAPLPPNYFGNSGLVSIYTPSTSELNALANYMWSDNGLDINDFKKIVNNPFDLILGLSYIPLKVTIAGQRGVNVGNILAVDTGLTMSYPTSESYEHDFGNIVLNEEEQAFIDYAPYSKVSIYLPFIGMQTIDIDLLRKNKKYNNISAMKVMYRYNIVTGAICATLYTIRDGMNKPYYTWIGSVGDAIPVASNDYSQSMIALTNMASNAVMGGLVGGSVGGAIGAVAGVATSALSGVTNTVSTLKPTINTNGAIGGSCASINSVRQCYLIVEQPPLSIPNNYGYYAGYPRNVSGKISSSRGFNVIQTMRLGTETDCMTDLEREELQQILTSGYIYGNDKRVDPSPTIPSSDDMSVALYQTESSAIRIDKKCTLLHNYANCVCKDNTSVVTPTIKLKVEGTSNILSANYAYIPKFKRFYFIRNIRNITKDLWEIDLKCDVLMSFKNDFIHNKAIFKRSEYNYNLYLNDGSIQLDSRSRIHIKKFPNDLDNSGTYVLIMAGKS